MSSPAKGVAGPVVVVTGEDPFQRSDVDMPDETSIRRDKKRPATEVSPTEYLRSVRQHLSVHIVGSDLMTAPADISMRSGMFEEKSLVSVPLSVRAKMDGVGTSSSEETY